MVCYEIPCFVKFFVVYRLFKHYLFKLTEFTIGVFYKKRYLY